MKRRFSAFSVWTLGALFLIMAPNGRAAKPNSKPDQAVTGLRSPAPREALKQESAQSEAHSDAIAGPPSGTRSTDVDYLPGPGTPSSEQAFYRGRAETALRSILRHPIAALAPMAVAWIALVWGSTKQRFTASRRLWIEAVLSLILILEILALLALAGLRIARPVTWDFPHFYMVGRAAAQGLNYADPEVLRAVYENVRADPAAPPVEPGAILFKYFPMSALALFYLGLFSYRSALVVHYITQITYLVGATFLLRKIGDFERSYSGLLSAALLVMSFLPVYGAISVAQIGFGALFWLVVAMVLLNKRPLLSGVALGFGFLYKHLLVIPLVVYSFLRRYRTIAGFMMFVVLAAIVIVALFGRLPFETYFEKGPVSQNNQKISGDINISLIATMLRLSKRELPDQGLGSILAYSPFLAGALLLTAITILVCLWSQRHEELSLLSASLPVLLALMIFPHVLYNTLPVALAPLFAIHSAGNQISSLRSRMLVVLSLAVQYGIVVLRPYPYSFLMPATTWITAVVVLMLAGRDLRRAKLAT